MAIASAIEAKLAGRVGRPSEKVANLPHLETGKSRDIAAAAVGMGKDTYRLRLTAKLSRPKVPQHREAKQ